jgi:hypothetical protein
MFITNKSSHIGFISTVDWSYKYMWTTGKKTLRRDLKVGENLLSNTKRLTIKFKYKMLYDYVIL